jgi:hypothetical protein
MEYLEERAAGPHRDDVRRRRPWSRPDRIIPGTEEVTWTESSPFGWTTRMTTTRTRTTTRRSEG